MTIDRPARFQFLGVVVDAVTAADLNEAVHAAVAMDNKIVIGNHNLHSLYLHERSADLRNFCSQAELIHADGMGVVLIARFLGHGLTRRMRVNYSQWFDSLLPQSAERGYRIALVGGPPGAAELAAENIRSTLPSLPLFAHHGFFDIRPESEENAAVLRWLRDVRPNILVVGMGMPRQETWIIKNLPGISANVILNGGGIVELLAGLLPEPPRWVGAVGLEWLYRLITRPRRTWYRYLVEPWTVASRAIRERFSRRSPIAS